MKNLEEYITKAGEIEDAKIGNVFALMGEMITQYTAGKQVQHFAKLNQIEDSYNDNMISEHAARKKVLIMLGNVAQEIKVI